MVETSVVILNYNGKQHLKDCFESLKKQSYKNFEIIFVDNASKDGSIEYVKEKYPKTRIISNSTNLGFAGGNNAGMRVAKGEFVVALNNDTKADKNWLKNLVQEAKKHPLIGMCASKMVYFDDPQILNSAGLRVDKNGRGKDIGIKGLAKNHNRSKWVVGPCGGAALYKKQMLEDVKEGMDYFDSSYFIYYEDLDLALRGQSRGWRCRFVADAIVYHKEGMDTSNVKGLGVTCGIRNKVYTIVKNWPSSILFVSFPAIIVDQSISFFYYLFKLDGNATRARLTMLKNLPLMTKKRRIIQQRKKVDISPLLA
tara:strand:- start:823 stop:1755 length:933 start_codon:yes stop_codon:yes gene_type:complete